MKKVLICICFCVVLLLSVYMVGTGFIVRHDIILSDFSLSQDGTQMTLSVTVPASMGFVRDYQDIGGGVKPHMLRFYSAFGGLNGTIGAKSTFVLPIAKEDTEIYFSRPGGGYELVLWKAPETGVWERTAEPFVVSLEEAESSSPSDLLYRGEPWEFHDLVYRGETVAMIKTEQIIQPHRN